MLKTRARYVPWSLRQPLLALETTAEKGAQGRLWTSTLTEPLQLLTYREAPGTSTLKSRPSAGVLRVASVPALHA